MPWSDLQGLWICGLYLRPSYSRGWRKIQLLTLTPGETLWSPQALSSSMRSIISGLLIVFSMMASAAPAPTRFEAVASQAETARVQDRVSDAIRLYREGTELRPSWADGWWYLGSLLYDQDRFA